MIKSIFNIQKMDCPSEENLIRMKLDDFSFVKQLEFDIPKRKLTVFHTQNTEQVTQAVESLNLNSNLLSSEKTDTVEFTENNKQTKLLWAVLIINFTFFIIEIITGVFSKSMGLVADSLDMLADSLVYGMSLLAVGGSILRKKKVAKLSGYFQMLLALIGFAEICRRVLGSEVAPNFNTMIIVSIFALIANSICLFLLQKSNSKQEAHMQASMIFTSNDVIINIGVIIAGLLVSWTNSSIPDLLIGAIVFILVIQGALRILKLGKT